MHISVLVLLGWSALLLGLLAGSTAAQGAAPAAYAGFYHFAIVIDSGPGSSIEVWELYKGRNQRCCMRNV